LDEGGATDVALRVRGPFDQLTEFVAITLGPAHVPATLEDHHFRLFTAEIETVAVENAAVDNEVVALEKRQYPVRCLQRSFAFADVNELVSLRVPVEMRVVLVGLDVEHRDVLIEQQRYSIESDTTAFLHPRS